MKKSINVVNVDFNGEVVIPLHLSTICSQKFPGTVGSFEYCRIDNPTRIMAQNELASFVGSNHCLLCSSGMAAITNVLMTLSAKDHILVCDNLYEGTQRLLKLLRNFGMSVSVFCSVEEIKDLVRENTKMIFIESMTNPLLKIFDIKKLSLLKNNAHLVIDATFTPPGILNPFDFGADIVIHSTTKFIGGHHDTLGGAIFTNNGDMFETLEFNQQTMGNPLSPFDCLVVSKGLKTLSIRLEKQSSNAQILANWFDEQDEIEETIFPGLKSHPNHKIAQSQMKNFGTIISVKIKQKKIESFFKKLKLVKFSQSFGGFSTIIQVPRKMMEFDMEAKELDKIGITENLIRISVGLEDIEDIIGDFKQALAPP